MIVDAHTHIFESGTGPGGIPASADDLIREMDAAGVDIAVVIPLPGVASNEFVQAQRDRFPDRLAAICTPDFTHASRVVEQVARFFREHDARGLKIHPRLQGVTIEDAVVRDVLHWAAESAVTVIFDAFPFGPTAADARLHPAAYVATALELPNLRLVLAHAGGHLPIDAFLAAKACPNIALDVSLTFQYYAGASIAADLAFVCGRLPPGHVAYGSDFPQVGLAPYLARVRSALADLPETHERELFGEAACRLFDLRRGEVSSE